MSKERELLKKAISYIDPHEETAEQLVRDIESILSNPEKTHIVWIPNTGVIPEYKRVLVRFHDGMIGGRINPNFYDDDWKLNSRDPIKEYAIIEE